MSQNSGQSASSDLLLPGGRATGLRSGPIRPISGGQLKQALVRIDLLRSLEMHRTLALVIALIGAALAIACLMLLWPAYVAQSIVSVQPRTSGAQDTGALQGAYGTAAFNSFIQQQMLKSTSTEVLIDALHKLAPGSWQHSDESDQAAVERLRRAIVVSRLGESSQFSIGARASNPRTAAMLANAVTGSYIESVLRGQRAGDALRLATLREELAGIQSQTAADRAEQDSLNKQLGAVETARPASAPIDSGIERARAELVQARTNHDEAEAQFDAIDTDEGVNADAINTEVGNMIAADTGLSGIKASFDQRRTALASQMATLTPDQPEYKQDAAELAKIGAAMDSTMRDLRGRAAKRIQEQLRATLQQTAQAEAAANARLRDLVAKAPDTAPKLQRTAGISADISRLQNRSAVVEDELHNLMLKDGAPGATFLTTPAEAPPYPARSGMVRDAILMILFAVLLGMLAAVAAHQRDPRVYTASDVERVVGAAPVAQLPDFAEVSEGVSEEHLSRLSALIETACKQNHLKSCVFTAAGSGAGVTTVVSRVRAMLEKMGRPTVLVDASGVRDQSQPGGDHGQSAPQRTCRTTGLLQIVSEETAKRADRLTITDGAPLHGSAEMENLVRSADCAIVVIQSGATTRKQLRDVADSLQQLDAAVGFVLNRIALPKADPAFRRTVRALEKHLADEVRFNAWRAGKSGLFGMPGAPVPALKPKEASAHPQTEQAAPVAAVAADPVTPPAVNTERTAPVAAPTPPRASAKLPGRLQGRPLAEEPAKLAPDPETDIPWWLREVAPPPDSPVSTALAQLAEPPGREIVVYRPAAEETRTDLPVHGQLWDLAANRYEETKQTAIPAEIDQTARKMDHDDAAAAGTSRLSGLRNLHISDGLKNLSKTGTSLAFDDSGLRALERTAFDAASASSSEPLSSLSGGELGAPPGFAAGRLDDFAAAPAPESPGGSHGKYGASASRSFDWGGEDKEPEENIQVTRAWLSQFKKD